MTIEQKQKALLDRFSELSSWEARYKAIIDMGKKLSPMPEELKSEDNKVKGCQSQVWIHATFSEDQKVIFTADSDALIVKGLVALLLSIYSGASCDEILSTPVSFLKELGLDGHLSPSRANGLYSMLKQIIFYATAFKAKANL